MQSLPAITLLLSAVLAFPFGGILAQEAVVGADQVEEDWELVIETPDVRQVGPQITTTMSPTHDNATFFVAFNLNYRSNPSFQAGGMQIEAWKNKEILEISSRASGQFNTPGEVVTWTQRMSIGEEGRVRYQVTNGQSTTWGQFGQGNGLSNVSFPTALNSLADYRADYSAANSAASWQSNHVARMTLVRVRYYSSGRLVLTDNTPRTILPVAASSTTD